MKSSSPAFGKRQRQAVLSIHLHSQYIGLLLAALEQSCRDSLRPLGGSSPHSMYSIDHPHGFTVHQDRRECIFSLLKDVDMRFINALEAGGLIEHQRRDHHLDHG